MDISVNSWGPVVCVLKHQGEGRRLQQCMFSPDHPDSPCEICEDFSFTGKSPDGCEEAVSKYCLDNYEMDPIACAEHLDLFVSCEYREYKNVLDFCYSQLFHGSQWTPYLSPFFK